MQSTATKEITATANDELEVKGKAARKAARRLATISAAVKNAALHNVADGLKAREEEILAANEKGHCQRPGARDLRSIFSIGCC